eukprot:4249515-Amphidinium_carterae.3
MSARWIHECKNVDTRAMNEVRALRVPTELGGAPYAWNDLDLLQTGNYHQALRLQSTRIGRSLLCTEETHWASQENSRNCPVPFPSTSTG